MRLSAVVLKYLNVLAPVVGLVFTSIGIFFILQGIYYIVQPTPAAIIAVATVLQVAILKRHSMHPLNTILSIYNRNLLNG